MYDMNMQLTLCTSPLHIIYTASLASKQHSGNVSVANAEPEG